MNKLPLSYYQNQDVVGLSQDLLGKLIVTQWDGVRTSGIIVETEAYRAPEDKASHAYQNKKTPRTATMFEEGGIIYMYLCYGMHHLLNIVTGPLDMPHAILIRAIEPVEGVQTMCQRRGLVKIARNLCGGPALVSQALGLTCANNGLSLSKSTIWIEEYKTIQTKDILKSPRVGVGFGKEFALMPWRFRVKNSAWTSPAK